MTQLPILWSFRRCPYAMRARLAIASSGQKVELREILLRDKPAAFLATSAKGTVPVLDLDGTVIAESIDAMHWALGQSDPANWLNMPGEGHDLIAQADGPFKTALDRYKYYVRHPDGTRGTAQQDGAVFLAQLDKMLLGQDWLFGRPSLADMAILPFVRQFANTDRAWFDAQDWPDLLRWLAAFTQSTAFADVMTKYTPWQPDQDRVLFG
ncbi:MAG: glutathione S-transferase [Yoonia sp.]|nr:glutathione S-transferase [Yoonia sp.]